MDNETLHGVDNGVNESFEVFKIRLLFFKKC